MDDEGSTPFAGACAVSSTWYSETSTAERAYVQSFLDVTLPPLLLLIGVAAVVVFGTVITLGRLRLYAAKRQRLIGNRKALSDAKDAVASIISETMDGDKVRTFATTAYEKLNSINTKEMERE